MRERIWNGLCVGVQQKRKLAAYCCYFRPPFLVDVFIVIYNGCLLAGVLEA